MRIGLACGVVLLSWLGCGDDTSSESTGSVTTTATASSTAASGGGASTSASVSGSGGSVGASGGSVGGAGGAGATTTGVGGAGGSAPGAGTVPCAGDECLPGQVCCFDNGSNTQVGCDDPGACGGGQIELRCNHPDDCPGSEVCCSAFDGMVLTMTCQATCALATEYAMCSGPDQSACPMSTTCSGAQAGQGYHYCAK